MARTAVTDLGEFLLGWWRVERQIFAAGHVPTGRFTGEAVFAPDVDVPGLLRYAEEGTVELGAHRGPAFRRPGYHVDGPTVRVVFEDGRSFHDLDLRDGTDEVVHPCGADRYRGRFEVLDRRRWRQVWTVSGPRKDATIVTTFVRGSTLAAAGAPPRAGETRAGRHVGLLSSEAFTPGGAGL